LVLEFLCKQTVAILRTDQWIFLGGCLELEAVQRGSQTATLLVAVFLVLKRGRNKDGYKIKSTISNRVLIILLKTKRRLFYLKTLPYRAVNTFHLGYKNQSVYAVSGTSRCLFWDKYNTNKYSVGRMCNS